MNRGKKTRGKLVIDADANHVTSIICFCLSWPRLQHSVVYRRFYISNRSIHCPDDIGWLNIKDRANSCSWEASSQIPVFVYSKAKTMINWQNAGRWRCRQRGLGQNMTGGQGVFSVLAWLSDDRLTNWLTHFLTQDDNQDDKNEWSVTLCPILMFVSLHFTSHFSHLFQALFEGLLMWWQFG